MRTIAVTGGKGGIGKTVLASGIGIALSRLGHRVVIFDADLGLANLDVVMGVEAQFNVQHALDGVKTLQEIVVEGPQGVRIIAGGSGIGKLIRTSRKRLIEFLSQISGLAGSTDYLIFDTAAGVDARVMTFLRASDQVVLVVTPDPASIVDAYATAKVLFRQDPNAAVRVVANTVANDEQGNKVFSLIQSTARTYLNKELSYLGSVCKDDQVSFWTRRRRPFLDAEPSCPASHDVTALAARLSICVGEDSRPSLADRMLNAFNEEGLAA